MTATRAAFIGLGVMGYPMAGHLARAGLEVTVYNRTVSKAEGWISEHIGKLARTPAEAAEGADIVLSCVGNDDDVRDVTIRPRPPHWRGSFTGSLQGGAWDSWTRRSPVARLVPKTAG